MKLDKTMFLVLAMITLFFVFLVGILARFGSKISTDPSFNMFFSWYVGLFMINLLNILGTLLFHFFLTDLPGERGLKGKPGEKGLEGEHDKCFCDTAFSTSMESIIEVINAAEVEYANYLEITEITEIEALKEADDSTISEKATNLKSRLDTFGEIANSSIKDYINANFEVVNSVNKNDLIEKCRDFYTFKATYDAVDTDDTNLKPKLDNINYNGTTDMLTLIKKELQPEIYGEATNIHSHGVTFNDADGDQIKDLSTSLIHQHNPTQNNETSTIEDGGRDPHNHTGSGSS